MTSASRNIPSPCTRAACTIVSKNYIASARTLAESLRQHCPDTPLFVLLVDEFDGKIDPEAEPFTLLLARDLPNIPDISAFFFKYDILELNTAVKPYFYAYLAETYAIERLIYFDPDIYLFDPLDAIWEELQTSLAVLTPHITSPVDDTFKPGEIDFLRVGTYNLGFIGMNLQHPHMGAMLQWWQRRLYDGCRVDLPNGYFTDQKWMDLLPSLFPDVAIFRGEEYNVAYWNLAVRIPQMVVERTSDRVSATVCNRPLGFFHYSGYSPDRPESVSKHQDRFSSLNVIAKVRPLFDFYGERLKANGYDATRKLPYAYNTFKSGTSLPSIVRRLYFDLPDNTTRYPDPFDDGPSSFFAYLMETVRDASGRTRATDGLARLWWHIWRISPDLQRGFPSPGERDRGAYIRWIHGDGRVRFHDIPEVMLPQQGTVQAAEGSQHSSGTSADPDALARPRIGKQLRRVLGAPLKALLRSRNRDLLDKIYYWSLGPDVTRAMQSLPASLPTLPEVSSGRHAIDPDRPLGVNMTGYLRGEFGVGEASRALIHALHAAKVPTSLSLLEAEVQRNGDTTFPQYSEERPYAVNVIAVNADMVGPTLQEKGTDLLRGRYNIGAWYWELSTFPEKYYASFDPFQEIWVTSRFSAEALSLVAPIPVVKITYPVEFDTSNIRLDRERFGISEDTYVFLFLFDYHSVVERKNPFAVVEAFRRAFGTGQQEAMLLLKTMNGQAYPEKRQALVQSAEGLNVRFIDEQLSRAESYNLIASSDCVVSLHRAEGLGLGMAEAMYLGKPVIATAYSGNMDFMDVNTALLVRYRLVELDADYGPYPKGSTWAEPDLDHAAEQMRFVFGNPDAGRQLGNSAATYLRQYHSKVVVGQQMRSRLERILSSQS